MKRQGKVFHIEGVGRLLAVLEQDEDGDYVVRYKCRPVGGFGYCSIAPGWGHTDAGRQRAQAHFDAIDDDKARLMADRIVTNIVPFSKLLTSSEDQA